jgi:hypothetical protein
LAITLPKWAYKNNGFTYMLWIKSNFCQKWTEASCLSRTSCYQCIPPKWTNTYAHDKDIALSHQSLTAQLRWQFKSRI